MITTTPSRRSRAATARQRVLGGGVALLLAVIGVTFAGPATVGASPAGDIPSNTVLTPDAYVESANGEYRLTMTSNGNLVLMINATNVPAWQSGTAGHFGAIAAMQSDGNLVVYSSTGVPLWMSGTFGNAGAHAVVQNDGNFVVYTASGQARWQSGTAGAAELAAATLGQDEYLIPGELLISTNEDFVLVMQTDGNVVLYDATGRARFQTRTYGPVGQRGDALVMNGRLMVVDELDRVMWDTPTGGTYAVLQNDGNFVIYTWDGAPVWQTGSYN